MCNQVMDPALRFSVADLVRQRGTGEITRTQFFERLATLEQPASDEPQEFDDDADLEMDEESFAQTLVTAAQMHAAEGRYGPRHSLMHGQQQCGHNSLTPWQPQFQDPPAIGFGLGPSAGAAAGYASGSTSPTNESLCAAESPGRPQALPAPPMSGGGGPRPAWCAHRQNQAHGMSVDSAPQMINSGAPRPAWCNARESVAREAAFQPTRMPETSWTSSVPHDESMQIFDSFSPCSGSGSIPVVSARVAAQTRRSAAAAPEFSPKAGGRAHGPFGVGRGAVDVVGLCATASPPGTPSGSRSSEVPSESGPHRCQGSRSAESSFTEFAQRNQVWELQRARRCQEMRRQREAEEVKECSFHPAVSSTAPRGTINHSQGGRTGKEARGTVDVAALTRRLATPSPSVPRLSREAAQWRERREHEDLRECTFQPDLSKSFRTYRQRNSMMSDVDSANASTCEAASDDMLQQVSTSVGGGQSTIAADARASFADSLDLGVGAPCNHQCRSRQSLQLESDSLFIPQTNPVPPSMVNARAYLQDDVFTRLTQHVPRCSDISQDASESSSILGRSRSEASLAISGLGGQHIDQTSTGLSRSFAHFLQRQNELEEDRRERLAQLAETHAPPLRPALCERSTQLVERRRLREQQHEECRILQQQQREFATSSIWRRQASAGALFSCGDSVAKGDECDENRHVQKRSDSNVCHEERECTFKPKITVAAAKLAPRGAEKLSEGDRKRREARIERLRADKRKKEEKDIGKFKPSINTYNGVGGRLRIREDPDTLIDRMDRARKTEMQRLEKDSRSRKEKEDAQCTFQPQVRPAPEFVRRMAESYRAVRALKEKENRLQEEGDYNDAADVGLQKPQSRPEWK